MPQGHWQKRRESFEGVGVERGRNYKPRREGSAERAGQKQHRSVQRGGERKEKEPQSQPRGNSTSQEVREKVWQQGEEGVENINDDSVLNDDKIDNCNVFKVLYTNARSIVGKIDLLRTELEKVLNVPSIRNRAFSMFLEFLPLLPKSAEEKFTKSVKK